MAQHSHTHDHDHSHDHGHSHGGHSHAHAPDKFNWAFGIAVLLNLGFTVLEAIYAVLSHSMSLLADAGHNLGDVLGLLLAWGASWLLTLPAKKRYSYGYKRTTILAALINALILVATSAIIAIESIHKLLTLTHINETIVIVVATIGIFINGGTALLFMKGASEDLNIKAAFLHLAGDALIALGVVIAAIIILFTGWYWVDPVVGLLIVSIILWGTWGIMRDSLVLIMDAVPRYIDHRGIQDYLGKLPGVIALHDLHIWGLSTKEVALTAHLVMPEKKLSDADFKMINAKLKKDFRIHHATLQVETGNRDHPCGKEEVC